jgi:hypothetical protein
VGGDLAPLKRELQVGKCVHVGEGYLASLDLDRIGQSRMNLDLIEPLRTRIHARYGTAMVHCTMDSWSYTMQAGVDGLCEMARRGSLVFSPSFSGLRKFPGSIRLQYKNTKLSSRDSQYEVFYS